MQISSVVWLVRQRGRTFTRCAANYPGNNVLLQAAKDVHGTPNLCLRALAGSLSIIAMRVNMASYAATSADWGGMSMMVPYLVVCGVTFVAGVVVILAGNRKASRLT